MIETFSAITAQDAAGARSTGTARATLLLPDGTHFQGCGLGPPGVTAGELVFTTAMTGYQEALTDPSYRGQVLMFTYPLIGNYGVYPGRAQSPHVQPRAVIVSTLSESWAGQSSLAAYLQANGVPTLHGVDTRAIARWIRQHGAAPAAIAMHRGEPDFGALTDRLCRCTYDTANFLLETTVAVPEVNGDGDHTVAILDCGNKRSVIEELLKRGTRVIVLPAQTAAQDILALHVEGLVISNGPGNPAQAGAIVDTLRALYGKLPMFGICLGHQLLALAAGARTFKLLFGHRGANHPVQDCTSGRAFITTQNHGYAVAPDALPPDLVISHRNLNDGTIEGLAHRTLPIRSVQFHPEGAPGPRDGARALDEWLGLIRA